MTSAPGRLSWRAPAAAEAQRLHPAGISSISGADPRPAPPPPAALCHPGRHGPPPRGFPPHVPHSRPPARGFPPQAGPPRTGFLFAACCPLPDSATGNPLGFIDSPGQAGKNARRLRMRLECFMPGAGCKIRSSARRSAWPSGPHHALARRGLRALAACAARPTGLPVCGSGRTQAAGRWPPARAASRPCGSGRPRQRTPRRASPRSARQVRIAGLLRLPARNARAHLPPKSTAGIAAPSRCRSPCASFGLDPTSSQRKPGP